MKLSVPPVTLPDEVDGSIKPRFNPTKPPMMLRAPGAVTLPLEFESAIVPRLMPANPPRKLSDVPVTVPDADEFSIRVTLPPANPPTTLFGPVLVTEPDAVAKAIIPGPSWKPF